MVFCGVDIGTGGTKAVVLDEDGHVLDTAAVSALADGGRVDWRDHFARVMDAFAAQGRFASEAITCSVTGQGGSFLLTDGRFQPSSDVCCWTELAEKATVDSLIAALGQTEYYHLMGWPPHGWLAAAKLKQMVERKQLRQGTSRIATVADFIYAQFTGELTADVTSAQITGLADFQASQWSRATLDWVGIDETCLPKIAPGIGVLAEAIETRWGPLTFVTGSHDQYAAMEAAGLVQDASVMLGTGTAWVIDGRTSAPLFDDERFLMHPGRDLYSDSYGLIVTLWQIGAGLDRLLDRFGLTKAALTEMEARLADLALPDGPVHVDLDTGAVEPAGDAALCIRRYMEWAASTVAHALEVCGLRDGLERIVATGGAMASRFWPQAIADICGLVVDAVDCPQFTAYGAALHARRALRGPAPAHRFPDNAVVRTYTPRQAPPYQTWYQTFQRPTLERQRESAS